MNPISVFWLFVVVTLESAPSLVLVHFIVDMQKDFMLLMYKKYYWIHTYIY